jgi:hypothetical protein
MLTTNAFNTPMVIGGLNVHINAPLSIKRVLRVGLMDAYSTDGHMHGQWVNNRNE